jgi:lysophospholipase L1-like esterase
MKIAFLGDSLTAGWPGASYFALLRTSLAGHELLNYGCAGDAVADLEARMSHVGMPVVDLAFVWIGVNDAFGDEHLFRGGDHKPLGLRPVFERLIDFVCEHAGNCVCVLPLLPDNGAPVGGPDYLDFDWRTLGLRVQAIAQLIGGVVAGRPAVRLLDLHEAFAVARAADPAAVFTVDGVHLSDHGARIVAGAFADALSAAFAAGGD